MMVEGWIALVALVVLAILWLVLWADNIYQQARREQRQDELRDGGA